MTSSPNNKSRHSKKKPSYDRSLCAYQKAFKVELRRIVERVPLKKEMRVLDVPCGNGFYSRFLVDRLDPKSKIDAVDLCPGYLSSTRKCLKDAACDWEVHEADAYNLPFADNTFDLVWCAQSLISLEDAGAALREMKRVVRPGGTIALLENDVFHHVLLSWPVDLEIPIQRAIQLASIERYGSSAKMAPARWLPQLFKQMGLRPAWKRTFPADRQAPWSDDVRSFLASHVQDLNKLICRHLPVDVRGAYEEFVYGRGRASLFGDETMTLTCLNVLYRAKK